ncbi:MAG: tRNA (N6-isopentenyl adenosine(37)-C2)-methylthiotransferase MiaB [Spirochaetaceae bacterium]|jgi:tRNA-2-methylthio-N6-dimethylallyladenosine synthase|nr:tRNA (N6-isopentenyl adenosine(37)-C2)-methylthiotransferase MiaB [Spirochaetaceae bacterium]
MTNMETGKPGYHFETYGCQMNIAESAALKLALNGRGWLETGDAENALLVVINTCSVRQTAEQRVFGRLAHYAALKKQRRLRNDPLFVLVCGCMASRLGGKLAENGADFIMGTLERAAFTRILAEIEDARGVLGGQSDKNVTQNEVARRETPPEDCLPPFSFAASHHEAGSFRAFVPIMHGCDNFCSYCVVPYTRGREVCRPPGEICAEIAALAESGAREVTLLGQNVNSYASGNADFPSLLERVARETAGTAIRRVRFLSSHPKDISRRTIEAMADNPVFCRHLHLCVQHGSNRILAAMNRRYTRERFLEIVAALHSAMPGITLSTDIMVGFPGETDDDFEEILTLMEETRFLYAFMYHYNPREGTTAFDMPGRVPPEVKSARLRRVIELQRTHTGELLRSRIGSAEEALVEGISRRNSGELLCRTERDETAVAEGPPSLIGTFAKIRLESLSGNTLRGRFLTPPWRK